MGWFFSEILPALIRQSPTPTHILFAHNFHKSALTTLLVCHTQLVRTIETETRPRATHFFSIQRDSVSTFLFVHKVTAMTLFHNRHKQIACCLILRLSSFDSPLRPLENELVTCFMCVVYNFSRNAYNLQCIIKHILFLICVQWSVNTWQSSLSVRTSST